MRTIADFVPFVAVKVDKNMPTPNIQHALRETLVTFLEMSRAAVSEVYPTQRAKDTEVLLEIPECRRLVGIEGVYLAPQGACGPASGQLRWDPTWEQIPMAEEYGMGWAMDDSAGFLEVLWITPAMPHDRRLCIRHSWTMKRDATCEVPDWIFERYADAISDGALAYLHFNPADDTASQRAAVTFSRAFQLAVDDARARRIATKFGPRQLRMSTGSFFRG